MTAALTAEGLHTYYGKSHILHGVSLAVAEGRITALLGRNGAGKTTFFNLISGFFQPTSGTIAFDGCDVTAMPAYQRVALGMARSSPFATVKETSWTATRLPKRLLTLRTSRTLMP